MNNENFHKDDLIDPLVIFGHGCCSKCGGQLVAVEMDMSFMPLNEKGSPIRENTITKTKGVCNACGAEHEITWHNGYFVYTSRSAEIMREYEAKYEAEKRMESLRLAKDNPFAIHTKEERQ